MQKVLFQITIGARVDDQFILDSKILTVVADNVEEAIKKVVLEKDETIMEVALISVIDLI